MGTSTGVRSGGTGERWRARLVAYGLVLGLVACALFTWEPWPMTSLRLFSQVRTGTQTQYSLAVVEPGYMARSVDFGEDEFVAGSARRQLPMIAGLAPAEQRALVEDLLRVAGVDPREVDAVAVARSSTKLDPDGGPPLDASTREVVTVELP